MTWTAKMRATQRCKSMYVECDQFVSQSKMLFLPEKRITSGKTAKAMTPVRLATYAMISW